MASGSPSRRRQISATGAVVAGRGRKSGGWPAPAARTAPSPRRPAAAAPATPARRRRRAAPGWWRAPRRPGSARRSPGASRAAASSTCSQLSSTSSSCRPRRYSMTVCSIVSPCRCCTPSAAATAWPTGPPSASGASSHSHTPSGNRSRSRPRDLDASRDLPTPPTPVERDQRRVRRAPRHRGDSSVPADKLVCRRGRLVGRGATGASAGSCSSSRWCACRVARRRLDAELVDEEPAQGLVDRSASAWRPDAYRACISSTDRRSRWGNCADQRRQLGDDLGGATQPQQASARSSTAASRRSSSRATSACASRAAGSKSASASPRHRPARRRAGRAARRGRPAAARSRASATRRSNRRRRARPPRPTSP